MPNSHNDTGADASGDPGLQAERTTLSWERTLLAVIVIGALFARWLPRQGSIVLVPLFICTVAAGTIWRLQKRRYQRALDGLEEKRLAARSLAVLSTTVLIVILGATGLIIIMEESYVTLDSNEDI